MMMIRTPQSAAGEEEEDGYFGRLPDEVIFNILDRVNDCKILTRCLLVSKRIASLVRLLSCVLVNIPQPPADAVPGYITKRCFISYDLYCVHKESIRTLHDDDDDDEEEEEGLKCWWFFFIDALASFYMCKAVEELHPFGNVKTAIVDYSEFVEISPGSNLRCIVEYSRGVSRGVIKSCAFIGNINNLRSGTTTLGCYSLKRHIVKWVGSCFLHAYTLHPMVARMVQDNESLLDISVTSASRHSWIHAGEDEIVKMRQAAAARGGGVDMTKMMQETIRMQVNAWYVPNSPTTVYAFVVVSSIRNIDRQVKSATRKFWGDHGDCNCNYWAGRRDEVIQEGFDRNMRELVETKPCHFEGIVVKAKDFVSKS